MVKAALKINNLTVNYGKIPVLSDFSLEVAQGEAVLLKGESGCGKSTLLHTICGLIPGIVNADVSGEVLIFETPVQEIAVRQRAEYIGIVFQNPDTQLFCDTVEDEIAFGLENLCISPEKIGKRICEALSLVQMEEFRYASPKELSGGQKQRVVLAAVLALKPRILLLDETLSQMDDGSKKTIITHLHALRDKGYTMLMVDHDDVLVEIADRVIELQGGY